MAKETLCGIALEHLHRAEAAAPSAEAHGAGAQLVEPHAQRRMGFNIPDRVVAGGCA